MAPPKVYRPGRALLAMAVLTLGLVVWAFWPGSSQTPRLGLDLQGGTQVILVPRAAEEGQAVTDVALQQSVEIIRQRVNAFGVAEAEVSVQGSGDNAAIVVSVPGVNQQEIADQIKQTALLDFRPVSQVTTPVPQDGTEESPTPAFEGLAPVSGTGLDDPQLLLAFVGLDCTLPENLQGGRPDDPEQWIVTCASDGSAKYLLEPAFIRGTNVTDAQATLPPQGGSGWQVDLTFDDEGAGQLADVSSRLVALPPPQNQFAIVLDGLVQSAPRFEASILGGQAQITGSFTVEQARELANILKYGALPLTLDIAEVTTVSATLGSDQLRAGLIAGALGLLLVAGYLLLYYRALGLVAVFSLVLAAVLTYSVFVIMGRTIGLALTLAGVAGAVVAIGITADSFIVYFERIRDEIREGRSLRSAAEVGWRRARNTILAADFVSLLAAVILYIVSVGNVRGFAFVLGLTTVIDVIVAFWFTRPLVSFMARTSWFSRGGRLTGVNPERLGVAPELRRLTDTPEKETVDVGV